MERLCVGTRLKRQGGRSGPRLPEHPHSQRSIGQKVTARFPMSYRHPTDIASTMPIIWLITLIYDRRRAARLAREQNERRAARQAGLRTPPPRASRRLAPQADASESQAHLTSPSGSHVTDGQ
jgi:hypothetical protein